MCMKIVAVCCFSHMERTEMVHRQSAEIFNVEACGIFINHHPLNEG